ncbi:MAG: hypothetical protein IM628_12805 [Phenylobacterium sp.]|uniref:DNA primase family protein n=1 Tax=Phenylobacterium sp. TaxID=1871053 RepID=UPI0025FD127F|nr:phage/plasmid primase, P4 family [Phenylobacterium sp.]MCA6305678.1 hypothetical protein [Phenylobacterium sp.]
MTAADDLIRRIVAEAGEFDVPPEGVAEIDHRLAQLTRNDLGNAKRLLARHGDDLVWVEPLGWHAWTGTCWSHAAGARAAQEAAHRTAMAIYREAKAIEIEGPKDGEKPGEFHDRVAAMRTFAKSAGNTGKLAGMLAEARPYRWRTLDDLDADPAAFNVRNGTLAFDVRPAAERAAAGEEGDRVTFRPHRRGDLISHTAAVDHDPEAGCPHFLAFLAAAVPDPQERQYLQRWFGYSMTGLQRDQKVTCLSGVGSNGKSTLIETLEALFGDYALRLPFASLTEQRNRGGGQATPDLVRLPGRRLVVAAEPPNGAQLDPGTIKTLTERTEMMARDLNQSFFTFVPQHHLTLMFNDPPVVRAQDDGTWRRLTLVQWGVRFVDPHERGLFPDAPLKDYALPGRLLGEMPGILNWLLDGLRLYLDQGLDPPETVQDATRAYRADNDPVGTFLRMALVPLAGNAIPGAEFYSGYVRWCEKSGLQPWSNVLFARTAKRTVKCETRGVVRYLDVAWSPEFREAVDP